MPRFMAALLLAASLCALDANDAFWSGWRKSAEYTGISGIYADGQRVIAWSPMTYRISDDAGTRWSDDRMPAVQLVAGSAPSQIAQCVLVGKTAWIRLVDGRVVDAAGSAGNALLGNMACTRLAVDQRGILYMERGDGQRTIAVRDGVAVAEAPGRLAAILDEQAVVMADRKAWSLSANGAKPLSDRRGDLPGSWPHQSGPGSAVWRDVAGAAWAIKGNALENTGNLQDIQVICQGFWGWDDRFVAYLRGGSAEEGGDIVSAKPKDLLRSGEWREGMPVGVVGVAGVAKDPDWETRRRLVVAAPNTVWVWRSR